MYCDYLALIVETYKQKKSAGELRPRLLDTTPAKLRRECLLIAKERFSEKDIGILSTFFGQCHDKNSVIQAIDLGKTDKLKPLDNFLKGDTQQTDDENIELLGWLINFEPRPYNEKKIKEVMGVNPGKGDIIDPTTQEQGGATTIQIEPIIIQPDGVSPPPTFGEGQSSTKPIAPNGKPKKPGIITTKRIAIAAMLAIIFGSSMYLLGKNRPLDLSMSEYVGCMYWAGDHYEKIACNEKMTNGRVIGFDTNRYKYFKRITKPDTITYASIRVLWYTKLNKDSIEYYTMEGFHPTDYDRPLKSLTKYMIDKYVFKKQPNTVASN